ncbi:MAG TPA: c-type cytochrome domain-containing protein [Edaphobacter sp.]|nr:c-type cytochrome domain-containing protein [Edaphobacter sp.]
MRWLRTLPWGPGIVALVTGVMAFGMALWCGRNTGAVQAATDVEAANPAFYTSRVRPIFQSNCFRCHAGMNRRGGLSMSTRTGMMRGGKDGAVVVPNDPAKSLLVQGIRHEGMAKPMPDKGKRLPDADIANVERWIRAGAVMPVDPPLQ